MLKSFAMLMGLRHPTPSTEFSSCQTPHQHHAFGAAHCARVGREIARAAVSIRVRCAGWLVGITSAISRPFKIQDRGLLKLNPNWQQTLRGERELSKAPCFSSTASQALLSQTTTFNLTTQTFTAISKTDNDGLAARLQGTVSKHWRFDGIVAHPRTSTFGTPPIKGDQAFLNLFANGLETSFEPKFIYRNANEKSSKVIGAFMYDRRRGGCELQRGCDGLQRLHRVN